MPTKSARIDIRLTEDAKQLIEAAAELQGIPVAAFAVSNLVERARKVIDDHHTTRLSLADMRRFVEILDSQEEPAPALRKAVKRRKHRRAR